MLYMRIPRNKFWAWVVVSMLIGLGIGLVIMVWRTAALNSQVRVLQNRVNATSGSTSGTDLASAEASITALTAQNAQLTSDLAAAQAQLAPGQGTPAGSTATSAAITVTSRSVSPSTVATSGAITLTVKVGGHPDSVTMRIYATSKSLDKTYALAKASTSGDSETWTLATKAPAKAGTYHYYATAIHGSTRVTMPGASPKSFTVH